MDDKCHWRQVIEKDIVSWLMGEETTTFYAKSILCQRYDEIPNGKQLRKCVEECRGYNKQCESYAGRME